MQTPTSSPECVLSVFQVIYRALTPSNKIEDPYSPEAQDLLKLTNLRLLLLKRQECPCRGLGLVEKPQRFAHYAIYDLIIRGSCFCNGHAEECESFVSIWIPFLSGLFFLFLSFLAGEPRIYYISI